MDYHFLALGVDIACGVALIALKKHYLSTFNVLHNHQSLNDFYKNNVGTFKEINNEIELIKESGCNIILSGELISNNNDGNKIFNDIVMWCQTMFVKSKNDNDETITPISFNVLCSPLVTIKRKLWKYFFFPVTESIIIKDPIELDGLESIYEVVIDKFMKHDNNGYRIMDKMIFSGSSVSIKGWLTCDDKGQYYISRNQQFSDGIYQVSKKAASELSNEINENKYFANLLSVGIKLTISLGLLLTALIIYKKVKNKK